MAKKTKSFVLCDESVNTYGFRMLMSGGDIEQFKKNPVMFYNHDEWDAPIGRWENIRIEGGKLLADPIFDEEDEQGRKISGKVERDFLRASSISLRVIETSDDPDVMLPGQKLPTVTRWAAREASIVGIGANHNALRLFDENDQLIQESDIAKLFDNHAVIPRKKQSNMDKEVFQILNLSENASEAEILKAVKTLNAAKLQAEQDKAKVEGEKKALADKLQLVEDTAKAIKKNEAEQLVDAAIREGKLNASAKKETLEFFDNNFDAAKKMIEGIPGYKSIESRMKDGDKSELEKLSDKTWDQLDKSGELQVLKDKYPTEYEKKFAEKFPK